MYNLDNHYENIYQYLRTIITDPRLLYLYPFGSTQPENIEIMRDDTEANIRLLEKDREGRRGPMFIFYDQEPLIKESITKLNPVSSYAYFQSTKIFKILNCISFTS